MRTGRHSESLAGLSRDVDRVRLHDGVKGRNTPAVSAEVTRLKQAGTYSDPLVLAKMAGSKQEPDMEGMMDVVEFEWDALV